MKNKLKKLRQGQTIYHIDMYYQYMHAKPLIRKIFLHSQKTELPEEGAVISKYPVNFVQRLVKRYGVNLFFSRRKAEKELSRILKNIINNT